MKYELDSRHPWELMQKMGAAQQEPDMREAVSDLFKALLEGGQQPDTLFEVNREFHISDDRGDTTIKICYSMEVISREDSTVGENAVGEDIGG